MLTEVLYPSFHPSCSPEWLGKCPSRGASGIGPGENASRDGVLRLFRSRAWKSIGKRFSQLILLLNFHLVCHCLRCLRLSNFHNLTAPIISVLSRMKSFFPGKVLQQLKLQRKQNIHNAARLRRK